MKAGVYLVGQRTQLEGRWPLALTFLQTQAAALGTVWFFTVCCSPQSSAQFYTPVLKTHYAISHGYDFIFVSNHQRLALDSEWLPPEYTVKNLTLWKQHSVVNVKKTQISRRAGGAPKHKKPCLNPSLSHTLCQLVHALFSMIHPAHFQPASTAFTLVNHLDFYPILFLSVPYLDFVCPISWS